jgi:hypothetical protein
MSVGLPEGNFKVLAVNVDRLCLSGDQLGGNRL